MNPLELKTLCKSLPRARYLDPFRKAVGEPSRSEIESKNLKSRWPTLNLYMRAHSFGPAPYEMEAFTQAYFNGDIVKAKKYLSNIK